MRKYNAILKTLVFVLFAGFMHGQTSVSVISGLYHSNTSSTLQTDLINLESINRLSLGVLVEQTLDPRLSLRTGIIHKQSGFQVRESMGLDVLGSNFPVGVKAVAELNTVEVPMMLQYNFTTPSGITPYISAGPSFTYGVSGAIKTKATAILDFTLSNTELNLNSPDFNRYGVSGNITAGTKLPYGNGHFLAEVGHNRSFTNLTSESFMVDTGLRPKGWTFNIGYGLSF